MRPRSTLADAEPADLSLRDGLLVCATEVTTAAEIDRFAAALATELASVGSGAR